MAVSNKVRIYELTKELGLSSWKEIADLLESKYGIAVKSHSSTIEQDLADKISAELKGTSVPEKKAGTASKKEPPASEKTPTAKTADSPLKKTESDKKPAKETKETESLKAKSAPASKPQSPAPASKPAPAVETQVTPLKASVSLKEPPGKAQESVETVAEEEDKEVLEILNPPVEEEPYVAISQTVERHQKQEPGKTVFKKVTETDKLENNIATIPRKEDSLQPQASTPSTAVQEPAKSVEESPYLKIMAPLTIAELAQKMKKRETELIRHLFMKGIMVTVNQTMQVEDAVSLAKEMGFDAEGPEKAGKEFTAAPELKVRQAKGKHLKNRAPVVSIMGHVDHGKTSLLDAIRETRHKIVDTEAGGITQSIGAYTVFREDGSKVVFIDTPGHEAFTAMRMRGAQATDIAILVVAADDGVMPQTIEAINHAKAANIPIIVAINKIDKADADPDRVLIQLTEHGLNPEKWGGDTITVEVSALQKLGLDDLLEMITLVSELQELKADATIPAEGVVIEARLDKGKGPVATVLVQSGTLHMGENILINNVGGRVRALINDSGERVKLAGPSTPVEVLGLSDVPQAGDGFMVVRNDKEFKRLLQQSQVQDRDQRLFKMAAPGLLSEKETGRKDFYLIIKGDTRGSVEAVSASLLQLATEEVSVHVLHAGTGDISEADVLLASASNAIIIAFNVKEEPNAAKAAQDRGIQIRPYDVIYHIIEDMEKLMLGLLSPETEEQEIGSAEVRQLFSFGKTTIAGCYVLDGKILRNSPSRIFRNGKELFKGQLNNLKRFKEDAKEVAAGYECGISFDKFNDLQVGDLIRAYTMKEIERTSL